MRVMQVTCGSLSTAVLGGDDTVYLLGRWDGLTSFVPSKLSKYATVRKSMKGTTPDVLETPLGIEEIKVCAVRNTKTVEVRDWVGVGEADSSFFAGLLRMSFLISSMFPAFLSRFWW